MAVSKTLGRKAPSQDGTSFFELKQQGGAYGKPSSVPNQPKSGTMREKIYGNKKLDKSQT
jgi:hypothetical protein